MRLDAAAAAPSVDTLCIPQAPDPWAQRLREQTRRILQMVTITGLPPIRLCPVCAAPFEPGLRPADLHRVLPRGAWVAFPDGTRLKLPSRGWFGLCRSCAQRLRDPGCRSRLYPTLTTCSYCRTRIVVPGPRYRKSLKVAATRRVVLARSDGSWRYEDPCTDTVSLTVCHRCQEELRALPETPTLVDEHPLARIEYLLTGLRVGETSPKRTGNAP